MPNRSPSAFLANDLVTMEFPAHGGPYRVFGVVVTRPPWSCVDAAPGSTWVRWEGPREVTARFVRGQEPIELRHALPTEYPAEHARQGVLA